MTLLFKPLLASPVDFTLLRYPVLGSPKLDGVRAVVRQGVVWSRSNKPIPNLEVQRKFGHLEGYDGELICGLPTDKDVYRNTVSRVMRIADSASDVTFYAFDSVQDTGAPYLARYADLQQSEGVIAVPQTPLRTEAQVLDYEVLCLAEGYEGVMLRRADAAYKQGRSTAREQILLKLKRFEDAEARVIGFQERMHNANPAFVNELGRLAHTSHQENKVPRGDLGALLVERAGVEFAIGSGFTDVERTAIWQHRDAYYNQLVKFKFLPTGGKIAPRHPIFLGWRNPIDL